VKNLFQETPLLVAAKYGRPKFITALLELGACVNQSDFSGSTALKRAKEAGSGSEKDRQAIVRILEEAIHNAEPPAAHGFNFQETVSVGSGNLFKFGGAPAEPVAVFKFGGDVPQSKESEQTT
jgi:hypothetical protein